MAWLFNCLKKLGALLDSASRGGLARVSKRLLIKAWGSPAVFSLVGGVAGRSKSLLKPAAEWDILCHGVGEPQHAVPCPDACRGERRALSHHLRASGRPSHSCACSAVAGPPRALGAGTASPCPASVRSGCGALTEALAVPQRSGPRACAEPTQGRPLERPLTRRRHGSSARADSKGAAASDHTHGCCAGAPQAPARRQRQ